MKINVNATAKVNALLAEVNGTANRHTFYSAGCVQRVAGLAEARLEKAGVPKKYRTGASATAISGDRLPTAYKYAARATQVDLLRGPSGWFVTAILPTQRRSGDPSWDEFKVQLAEEHAAPAVAGILAQHSIAA